VAQQMTHPGISDIHEIPNLPAAGPANLAPKNCSCFRIHDKSELTGMWKQELADDFIMQKALLKIFQ
jgi:hypothetical protein